MNTLMRIVVGLLAGLLGLAFLAAILVALGIYIAFATVRWLLTGRRPQVVMVWNQFSVLRKGAAWRRGPRKDAEASRTASDDVVDVEVREVREQVQRLPDDRRA